MDIGNLLGSVGKTNRLAVKVPSLGGDDIFVLRHFHGRETISRLFHYELDLVSEQQDIDPEKVVGHDITFSVDLRNGSNRFFNGIVNRFYTGGIDEGGLVHYRVEVVPWLWLLTQTADCQIFQKQKVQDILAQVFKSHKFSDYDMSQIKENHPVRDYCVQYRETDFNFVSRLMEEEGIFYFFKHEDGSHKMVLADWQGAHPLCIERDVEFSPGSRVANHVTSWEFQYQYQPGSYAQNDYNFETPTANLKTVSRTIFELEGNDKLEVFDYPGLYRNKADGDQLTRTRMEEEEAQHQSSIGKSTCPTFSAGHKFSLSGAGLRFSQSYILTSVQHSATEHDEQTPSGDGVGFRYHNSFSCMPNTHSFRPLRQTRKPLIQGLQSAKVVGPPGKEIHTDKYGRVKVQFFWDRQGSGDDKSSCWIRVAQCWAGNRWGSLFTPRVGHEVVVDFLEGDPDRPLITGSVYNAENLPPYTLPENATQSGVKTRSSPDGANSNFNEIRFEDKKGAEELVVHAERNLKTAVEAAESRSVGGKRSTCICKDDELTVEENRITKITGSDELTVETDRVSTIEQGDSLLVKGEREVTVKASDSLAVLDGDLTQTAPNGSFTMLGKEIVAVGLEKITLGVGPNFISIDHSGIRIQGNLVSSISLGINEVKGKPVMINC